MVRPAYEEAIEEDIPVQYVVLLDASGSMTWNFQGQGHKGGQSDGEVMQCEASSDPDLQKLLVACSPGPGDYWSVGEQRRFGVAKNTVLDVFVDGMTPNDVISVIAFSTSVNNNAKISSFRNSYWFYGTPEGKADFGEAVMLAGQQEGDPFFARGGTPGYDGMLRAAELLRDDNGTFGTPRTAPNGLTYKTVILNVTDGVSNQFSKVSGMGQNQQNFACPGVAAGSVAANTPQCQIGYWDMSGTDVYEIDGPSRVALPISAVVDQSVAIQSDPLINATVYSIAVGNAPMQGLKAVANQADFPYAAKVPTAESAQPIFEAIQVSAKNECRPNVTTFQNYIDDGQLATFSPDQVANNPQLGTLDSEVVGYVFLWDANGIALPDGQHMVPVVRDANGELNYSVPNMVPGEYQMEAYVGLTGADGVSRIYRDLYDQGTLETATRMTFSVEQDGLGATVNLPLLQLDLTGALCS